jgi:endonuclease/exonuclease/phosphatase family metal-dependent hydrolase
VPSEQCLSLAMVPPTGRAAQGDPSPLLPGKKSAQKRIFVSGDRMLPDVVTGCAFLRPLPYSRLMEGQLRNFNGWERGWPWANRLGPGNADGSGIISVYSFGNRCGYDGLFLCEGKTGALENAMALSKRISKELPSRTEARQPQTGSVEEFALLIRPAFDAAPEKAAEVAKNILERGYAVEYTRLAAALASWSGDAWTPPPDTRDAMVRQMVHKVVDRVSDIRSTSDFGHVNSFVLLGWRLVDTFGDILRADKATRDRVPVIGRAAVIGTQIGAWTCRSLLRGDPVFPPELVAPVAAALSEFDVLVDNSELQQQFLRTTLKRWSEEIDRQLGAVNEGRLEGLGECTLRNYLDVVNDVRIPGNCPNLVKFAGAIRRVARSLGVESKAFERTNDVFSARVCVGAGRGFGNPPGELQISSFNVRNAAYTGKEKQKQLEAYVDSYRDCDIIVLQEIRLCAKDAKSKKYGGAVRAVTDCFAGCGFRCVLPDVAVGPVKRDDRSGKESYLLAYRATRFELLDTGYSSSLRCLDVKKGAEDGTGAVRTPYAVALREAGTDHVVVCINVHLTPAAKCCGYRERELQEIGEFARSIRLEYAGDCQSRTASTIIVAGDFNFEDEGEASQGIEILNEKRDVQFVAANQNALATNNKGNKPYDAIMVASDTFQLDEDFEVDRRSFGSDHRPICATLTRRRENEGGEKEVTEVF